MSVESIPNEKQIVWEYLTREGSRTRAIVGTRVYADVPPTDVDGSSQCVVITSLNRVPMGGGAELRFTLKFRCYGTGGNAAEADDLWRAVALDLANAKHERCTSGVLMSSSAEPSDGQPVTTPSGVLPYVLGRHTTLVSGT